MIMNEHWNGFHIRPKTLKTLNIKEFLIWINQIRKRASFSELNRNLITFKGKPEFSNEEFKRFLRIIPVVVTTDVAQFKERVVSCFESIEQVN